MIVPEPTREPDRRNLASCCLIAARDELRCSTCPFRLNCLTTTEGFSLTIDPKNLFPKFTFNNYSGPIFFIASLCLSALHFKVQTELSDLASEIKQAKRVHSLPALFWLPYRTTGSASLVRPALKGYRLPA